MRRLVEPAAWLAVLLALALVVVTEGRRRADLERRLPVAPAELYRTLARSQAGVQVVDVRADLAAGYEDSHVPGALPMPGCDLARAPEAARRRIERSVPTVVVTAAGDRDEALRCLASFTAARALAGGMEAWSAASLPEDTGEYAAPSAKAGGGCL